MDTTINVHNNQCTKVVLEDGAINIPSASQIVINGDGKILIDGMTIEEYLKKDERLAHN